jgi:hypothetical protein
MPSTRSEVAAFLRTGAAPIVRRISIEAMRQVAGERNRLAHGHFDQNPFDGSYDVVTRSVRASYSVETLDHLTEKANRCRDELSYAVAYYQFADEP